MKKEEIKKRLGRPCNRCGHRFEPATRFCRICDICVLKSKWGRMKNCDK